MAEPKSERIEREYVIPLRSQVKFAPRYKRTKKAVRTIKEFLAQHMKIRDRDLDKIKLDKYLNEAVWMRGIRNPPHKIKVKAIKEKGIVRVELVDYPTNIKFKKLREERINKQAKESLEKKKTLMEKAKESIASKPEEKEETKAEEDAKEKEKTSAESTQLLEKETAKQAKHETKMKTSESKHQRRMILQK
jgi:large subunit ribosomal protein L31e